MIARFPTTWAVLGPCFDSIAQCALALALSGCQPPDSSNAPVTAATVVVDWPVPTPDSPGWSPPEAGDDVALARVNGVPILKSTLVAEWPRFPEETAEQVLDRLIQWEVLAQEASRRLSELGRIGDSADGQSGSWAFAARQRAVQELLHDRFMVQHNADAIRDIDYQHAYYHPQIRVQFDHHDGYRAYDVQLVCCDGDWKQCSQDEGVQQCLADFGTMAEGLRDMLAAHEPYASKAEYDVAIEAARAQVPQIRTMNLEFWYEEGVPYGDQKGYTKYFEGLVEEIRSGEMGRVLKPVRSHHAWHFPVKLEHTPAEHRPWNDPEVKREIAKNIYPQIRERDYIEFRDGLRAKIDLQVARERLELLLSGEPQSSASR